jgi:hypothetical protein
MTIQEYMIQSTRAAADEFFRYVDKIPVDQLDFKPTETNRSLMDLIRECAMAPEWAVDIINGAQPDWSEESLAAINAEQSKWQTVEHCKRECESRLEKLFALYRSLSDEKLNESWFLPFDGGRDFTVVEMMEYPRWNFNYHTGQVAYIQLMLGDKEIH